MAYFQSHKGVSKSAVSGRPLNQAKLDAAQRSRAVEEIGSNAQSTKPHSCLCVSPTGNAGLTILRREKRDRIGWGDR